MAHEGESDEALLERFRRGDASGFEGLFARHREPLFNFIYRLTRDMAIAEDLMQEAFSRLIRGADDFRGEAKVRTWLYGVARNLTIDHARRMKHRRARSLDAPEGADGEGPSLGDGVAAGGRLPEQQTSDAELRDRIAAAVDALPDDLREVFLLREVSETPFDEIAAIVGCPVGTAKSRMRHALEHLRKRLADLRDAPPELAPAGRRLG